MVLVGISKSHWIRIQRRRNQRHIWSILQRLRLHIVGVDGVDIAGATVDGVLDCITLGVNIAGAGVDGVVECNTRSSKGVDILTHCVCLKKERKRELSKPSLCLEEREKERIVFGPLYCPNTK
jgi:hypothetical protein